MAKIAVIFVLFALCAVAMSARIVREEPNVFAPILESLQNFGKSANSFWEDPKTKEQISAIQGQVSSLVTLGGEQLEKTAGEVKAKFDELAKNSEGPLKEFADNTKKAFDNIVNAQKKN